MTKIPTVSETFLSVIHISNVQSAMGTFICMTCALSYSQFKECQAGLTPENDADKSIFLQINGRLFCCSVKVQYKPPLLTAESLGSAAKLPL